MVETSKRKKELLDLAGNFPSLPGCYLMMNLNGEVIYVGKAKNLKNRVRSYFTSSQKSPKTHIFVNHIRSIDFMIVDNEAEALVLENNLIKKFLPRYNIKLKDDKSYPYVVASGDEDFPRLEYQKRPRRKKSDLLFGPFVSGSGVSDVVKILTRSFQLRDCTLRDFLSRKEPCLLYQMKQCSAPCVGKISQEEYRKDLACALDFFKNKGKKSLQILKERMAVAAESEAFERATVIRDAISKLEKFVEFRQQNAEIHRGVKDVDYIAYYKGELEVDISLYLLRSGVILGHKNFHFPVADIIGDFEQVFLSYLLQYYSETKESYPKQIVIDFKEESRKLFSDALNKVIDQKIIVKVPGSKSQRMVQLTGEHARESQRVRMENQQSVYSGLSKLAELLKMPERPQVLECFDIAIFQGKSPTAARVVFVDGRPDKSQYRHYHLEEREEGNNDFAMMRELFERRLSHGELPDVLIVDGGRGQVNVAREVLREFKCEIPVVGIAKEKRVGSREKIPDRLVIPGRLNPYVLSKNPSLFRLLVKIRDEAHRFSRRLHHKKETKRVINWWIDEIPGIGREIKKDILRHLVHTPEQLGEMNLLQLSRAIGVSVRVARRVKRYLEQKGFEKGSS